MSNLPAPARTQGSGGSKEALRKYLAKNVNHLAGLLPQGMDEKRMARIAMEAFREIPKLAECSPASLIGGILAAAQSGLAIGKAAGGEAYLIPFKNQAQFVIGVPGRVKLAYRSGHIRAARCGVVYADQHFEADLVTGKLTIGMRDADKNYDNERGQWYWASVETITGGLIADYFNRPTVESRRQKLQSKNSPAWRDHFDEMAVNMILRYVLKRSPKSAEQEQAEALDSRVIRPGDGSLVAEWVETDTGDDIVIDTTAKPADEKKTEESKDGDLSLKIEVAMKDVGTFNSDGKGKATAALVRAKLIEPNDHWYHASGEWGPVEKALGDLLKANE